MWTVVRKVEPFYYQDESFNAIEKGWLEAKKLLCVLPTGGGKTVLAGEIITRRVERRKRALVMAHTRKLAAQFRDSLVANYGLHVGLDMAGHSSNEEPVVCATFQSMLNRVAKGHFHEDAFDLVVIDEAHRALGPGYQRLAGHFMKADFLGLTATPRRTDQKDLMNFFDAKVVDIPLDKLIRENFLAPLTIVNCPISIKLNGASKTGDFTEQEVAHAIEPYLFSCAESIRTNGAGRCTLAFLPLIELSRKFTAVLQGMGVRAAHVDGTMKEKEVKRIILELEQGKVEVLCNSMLLTEGVDIRPVNCIMNLRPTKSWGLYVQIVGRATRTFDPAKQGVEGTTWPRKTDALLLDPLWLCDDLNPLKRPACLLAKDEDEEREIMAKVDAGESDLMKATGDALRERLERMAQRKSRLVDAMDFFLKQGDLNGADYAPVASWQMAAITQGQSNILSGSGIDLSSVRDYGHATAIIDKIMERYRKGLVPPTMAKTAEALGLSDAYNMKKADVAAFIIQKGAGDVSSD